MEFTKPTLSLKCIMYVFFLFFRHRIERDKKSAYLFDGKNTNITVNEAQSYFLSVIYWETKVHLNHSNCNKKERFT